MSRGGARAGAGRPRKAEQFPEVFAALDQRLAEGVPDRLDALEYLANGGYTEEEVDEVWEPAGLIFVTKQVVTKDGTVSMKELAFPELPPEQLVCVQRKVKKHVAAPDRKANEYLVDRFAGRPTQAIDLDTDPDGKLEITAAAMTEAAKELAAWRQLQTEQLNSLSAPPTLPIVATPTG